jgi:hypothetical protein
MNKIIRSSKEISTAVSPPRELSQTRALTPTKISPNKRAKQKHKAMNVLNTFVTSTKQQ